MRSFDEIKKYNKLASKQSKGLLRDNKGDIIEGRKKINTRKQLLERMNKSNFLN